MFVWEIKQCLWYSEWIVVVFNISIELINYRKGSKYSDMIGNIS